MNKVMRHAIHLSQYIIHITSSTMLLMCMVFQAFAVEFDQGEKYTLEKFGYFLSETPPANTEMLAQWYIDAHENGLLTTLLLESVVVISVAENRIAARYPDQLVSDLDDSSDLKLVFSDSEKRTLIAAIVLLSLSLEVKEIRPQMAPLLLSKLQDVKNIASHLISGAITSNDHLLNRLEVGILVIQQALDTNVSEVDTLPSEDQSEP